MASIPKTQQEGTSWSTIVAAGTFPDTLRPEGADEATRLTYLTKDWNQFTWLIHNNFKKQKVKVSDRIYTTREISELDRYYTCRIGSGIKNGDASREKFIALDNSQAVQLQPNDILYIRNIFAMPTGNALVAGQVIPGGANIGPDLGWSTGTDITNISFSRIKGVVNNGRVFKEIEQVRVVNVGEKNSAGNGLAWIELDRCYFGPGAKDKGGAKINDGIILNSIAADIAGNQASRVQTGDLLLRGMPAFKEGTNYPNGTYKNPISDNNFTQLFKYACEQTKESEIPRLWIKERPLDIHRWLTLRRMNRDREYSNLLGRKSRDMDEEGKEIYTMGGVREFIMDDTDHYIVYPHASLTWTSLLDLSKPLMNLNNSGELWGISGLSLNIALKKAFYNSHLWYSKEESSKFDMRVDVMMLAGIKINLITSQVFEEAGFGNEMLVLDMSDGDSFEPVTNAGWDMVVEKDIAEKGSNMVKEGIQGMFGLRRRKQERHCIIDFENAVPL